MLQGAPAHFLAHVGQVEDGGVNGVHDEARGDPDGGDRRWPGKLGFGLLRPRVTEVGNRASARFLYGRWLPVTSTMLAATVGRGSPRRGVDH
jgi:hypothetical protein